jgi:hypothetical protein
MAKQSPANSGPVDADHISRCLDASDDFAFEMQVLHVLKTANMNAVTLKAEHGGTYTDPVPGLPRQFDIRAQLSRAHDHSRRDCFLRLSVECKRLHPNAPLVVSRSQRTTGESFHDYIRSHFAVGVRVQSGVSRSTSALSFYQQGEFVGRSVTLVKSSHDSPAGDADIYTKWAQALASVDDLIWEGANDASGLAIPVAHSTALPCLVIPDGTLWTVDYDLKGNRSIPQSAESCEFYVGKPSIGRAQPAKFTITHLHIFTISGFEKFLLRKLANTEYWLDHFSND